MATQSTAFSFDSIADFQARAQQRLTLDLPAGIFDPDTHPSWGDHRFNAMQASDLTPLARPAAVLVPVVARGEGATVLLTKRASRLREHSGQIAFPGGKIDTADATPMDTALREAREEIGLSSRSVTPIGYLDAYLTGTGYRIVPVVAIVTPPFVLQCNPDEVEDAFEVPLGFLMDPGNHLNQSREWKGMTRHFYAMSFGERNIWGATAGILRNLYERLAD